MKRCMSYLRRGEKLGIGLVLAGLLAACQTTSDRTALNGPVTEGQYKVGKPYQIAGIWYYPKEEFDYDRTGLASWYGNEFKGRKTANGEIYDPGGLTAAHKTLPMPVMARVTNLENGNQIVVRINDRGPFVQGRIIDLSEKAATMLGFRETGVAKVRVEYIGKAVKETRVVAKADMHPAERQVKRAAPVNEVASDDLAPPPGAAEAAEIQVRTDPVSSSGSDFTHVPVTGPNYIYVQAGAFQMHNNALQLKSRLMRSGFINPGVQIMPADIDGKTFYRVQIGPIMRVEKADQLLAQVLDSGYAGARIVVQ